MVQDWSEFAEDLCVFLQDSSIQYLFILLLSFILETIYQGYYMFHRGCQESASCSL